MCSTVYEQFVSLSTGSGGSYQVMHCCAQAQLNDSKNIFISYLYFYMSGAQSAEFIYLFIYLFINHLEKILFLKGKGGRNTGRYT